MSDIDNVRVSFEVSSDASTPAKTALELNGLKLALAAIFSQMAPDEREVIISNIESFNAENTHNIVSILKSVHDSAK